MSLLEVAGLTVTRQGSSDPLLKDIDIKIPSGKVTALIGESGAGKTILVKTLAGLIPDRLLIRSGGFTVSGRPVSYQWIQKNRGKFVFYTPQNATISLNPVLKIKHQLNEMPRRNSFSNSDILEKLGLSDTQRILNSYPFELSGGENQRCLLAMAIALSPRLLILDEPETSLDVFLQQAFFSLIKLIGRQHPMTILVVTHNLTMVKNWSHRLYIMFKGEIVESGDFNEVLKHPDHSYTRELLRYFH